MKDRIVEHRKTYIIVLTMVLVAVSAVAACVSTPAAEQKKVVEVGVIIPLTGPGASAAQIGWRNMKDYLRYFEEIGIPGVNLQPEVRIELIWADDALEVPRAISAYQRFVERGVVFLYIFNPPSAEALKSRCERDGIPAIVLAATEAMMYPPGWLYSYKPTDAEHFAVVADWIMESWEEERPPRVALIGPDVAWGRATQLWGAKYAQSIGVEMLPMEFVPTVPLDVTPQLLRLSERGADYAYITSIWAIALPILRDADRLGLTNKVRFGGVENSQAIPLIQALGAAAEGYFAPRSAPWYKEVPFLMDMFSKYEGGRIDTAGDAASNLLFVPVMIEAVRKAIENVGYENLGGCSIKEALDSIKDFNPHGVKPITYVPTDHRGSTTVKVYEVRNGEVLAVTDWREAPMLAS